MYCSMVVMRGCGSGVVRQWPGRCCDEDTQQINTRYEEIAFLTTLPPPANNFVAP